MSQTTVANPQSRTFYHDWPASPDEDAEILFQTGVVLGAMNVDYDAMPAPPTGAGIEVAINGTPEIRTSFSSKGSESLLPSIPIQLGRPGDTVSLKLLAGGAAVTGKIHVYVLKVAD